MISPNLTGGLGNMMFQIAAVYSLALNNKSEYTVNLDSHYLPLQGRNAINYKDNIFKNIPYIYFTPTSVYNETDFTYERLPFIDGTIYNGYFQSYKYFIDNLHKVRELFHIDYKDEFKDYIGIHVRRGDYLKFPDTHPVCDIDYYIRALSYYTNKRPLLISSDDIQWAKQNFSNYETIFLEGGDDVSDFSSLASCYGIIGSNSTFSLWAALMKKDPFGLSIFPKKWFGPKGPQNTDDLTFFLRI